MPSKVTSILKYLISLSSYTYGSSSRPSSSSLESLAFFRISNWTNCRSAVSLITGTEALWMNSALYSISRPYKCMYSLFIYDIEVLSILSPVTARSTSELSSARLLACDPYYFTEVLENWDRIARSIIKIMCSRSFLTESSLCSNSLIFYLI